VSSSTGSSRSRSASWFVGTDVLKEALGVLAADEELDGVLRLGAHDSEDTHHAEA
jgi:hypothetical protein